MIVHVQQHAPTQVTPGHVVTCACACTVPQSRALCVSSLRSLSPTSPRGTSRTQSHLDARRGRVFRLPFSGRGRRVRARDGLRQPTRCSLRAATVKLHVRSGTNAAVLLSAPESRDRLGPEPHPGTEARDCENVFRASVPSLARDRGSGQARSRASFESRASGPDRDRASSSVPSLLNPSLAPWSRGVAWLGTEPVPRLGC